MGAERAFSTPILIRPRATSDGLGAGHRLARDCDYLAHPAGLATVAMSVSANIWRGSK